jgi:hypothetical protein
VSDRAPASRMSRSPLLPSRRLVPISNKMSLSGEIRPRLGRISGRSSSVRQRRSVPSWPCCDPRRSRMR